MTLRRLWFLGSLMLIMGGLLAATAGAGASAGITGYSVTVDSYTVGAIASSPSTAHVGDRVTFSGTGHLPDTLLEIGIIGRSESDIYSELLATVTSDSSGNWQTQVTVPDKVTRGSDEAQVPMLYGDWSVAGIGTGADGGLYGSLGTLTVVENYSTAPTTYYTTAVQGGALPSTGIPAAAPWLMGSGLVAGAGLVFERWRSRSRGPKTPPQ